MKRNHRLVEKRRKRIAVFLELKKQEKDYNWRKAINEIAEVFCIAPITVEKEMTRYNKSRVFYV